MNVCAGEDTHSRPSHARAVLRVLCCPLVVWLRRCSCINLFVLTDRTGPDRSERIRSTPTHTHTHTHTHTQTSCPCCSAARPEPLKRFDVLFLPLVLVFLPLGTADAAFVAFFVFAISCAGAGRVHSEKRPVPVPNKPAMAPPASGRQTQGGKVHSQAPRPCLPLRYGTSLLPHWNAAPTRRRPLFSPPPEMRTGGAAVR
jgi:hypothetical protein